MRSCTLESSLIPTPQPRMAAWLQVPPEHASVVQLSPSSQFLAAKSQAPFTQESEVQRSLSLHTKVSQGSLHPGIVVNTHPAEQVSLVQMSPSSQVIGVKTQLPPTQASVVQASPSLQVIGVKTQLPAAQASVVQAFPSSHVIGVLTQAPLVQVSVVQALLSLQLRLAQGSTAVAVKVPVIPNDACGVHLY